MIKWGWVSKIKKIIKQGVYWGFYQKSRFSIGQTIFHINQETFKLKHWNSFKWALNYYFSTFSVLNGKKWKLHFLTWYLFWGIWDRQITFKNTKDSFKKVKNKRQLHINYDLFISDWNNELLKKHLGAWKIHFFHSYKSTKLSLFPIIKRSWINFNQEFENHKVS